MPVRDRFNVMLFCALLAGLLLAGIVLDFVLRWPFATVVIVLTAFAFARRVKPFDALAGKLRGRYGRSSQWAARRGVPLVIFAVVALSVWANVTAGGRYAFLVLAGFYLLDVFAAWLFERIDLGLGMRRAAEDDGWRTREPAQSTVAGEDW